MNYYDFHVGDFRSATSHLTRTERSIYRDMIDMYYDTEQPLPLDLKILNRKLAARDEEEKEAVLALLDEFFIKTESGYFNNRCDEEIQKYHNNQSKKSLAGKASAAKREQERIARLATLNGQSISVQQNTDSDEHLFQQDSTGVEQVMDSSSSSVQLTNNQKPETNNQKETKVSKNSLSQNASQNEKSDDPNDWRPNLDTLNTKLKMAGAMPIDQTALGQTLVTFNPHYESLSMSSNQKLAKLVTWIKSDQQRAAQFPPVPRLNKPTPPAQEQPQRTTDTTKTKERKFEDYHDSQVYSGVYTAGQIRQAMQAGESPDQCVLRLTKAQFAKVGV